MSTPRSMGVETENAESDVSKSPTKAGVDFFDITQDAIECEKSLKNRLGDGQVGSTYKGKFKGEAEVAVKILRDSSLSVQKSLQDEARKLHVLQHANIIGMIGVQGIQSPFSIVYELAKCSLYEALYTREEKHPLRITKDSYSRKAKVLVECCDAFVYLHEHKVVHGNIKSSNILLTQEGVVKLSGFGFLKTKQLIVSAQQKPSNLASPKAIVPANGNNQSILTPYLAPELLIAKETNPRPFQSPTRPTIPILNNTAEYNEATDVYAFGILMNEVFDHAPPFPGLTPQNIITRLKRTDNNRPSLFARQEEMWIDSTKRNVFRDLQFLIKHCWKNIPTDRPNFVDIGQKTSTIQTAIEHPDSPYKPLYDHNKTESIENIQTSSVGKVKPVKEYAIVLPPRTPSQEDVVISPTTSSISKFNNSFTSVNNEDVSSTTVTIPQVISKSTSSVNVLETPRRDQDDDVDDDAMLEETVVELKKVTPPSGKDELKTTIDIFGGTPAKRDNLDSSQTEETPIGEWKLDFDEFQPTTVTTTTTVENSEHSKASLQNPEHAAMDAKMQLVDIHHIELLYYQSSFCYNAEAKIQLLDYAIDGVVLAEGFLMIMLYQGNGTEKDIPQAVNLFKKIGSWLYETANIDPSMLPLNNVSVVQFAQYILGVCFEYGIGMNAPNFMEAVKYYSLASSYGYTTAQVNLGYCFKHGLGVEKSLEEAIKLFTMGANAHHVEAIYQLACILFHMPVHEKDIVQAVKLYDIGAKFHHIACINALGYCHEHGIGTPLNLLEAVRLYTIAANYGLAIAQYNLGYCYDHGLGTEKNPTQAVEYYRLSANQGHIDAQCHLAYCYEFGKGTDVNILEAIKFYHLSAAQGHSTAQNTLGEYYKQGKYVNMNLTKAIEYFTMSANQQNALAQNNLGYCYQHGQGVPQNHSQAIVLYTSAAEQGNAIAQNNLGYCFQHGLGIPVNYEQAAQWYRLSSNQGYAAAQYNLGYCYANGLGVEVNLDEAFRLYTLSAQQGNPTAQQCLEYCYSSQWKGTGNPAASPRASAIASTSGNSNMSSSSASVISSNTNKVKSFLGWNSSSNNSMATSHYTNTNTINVPPTGSSHGGEEKGLSTSMNGNNNNNNNHVPPIRLPPPPPSISSPNTASARHGMLQKMPSTIQTSPSITSSGSNSPMSPRRTHHESVGGSSPKAGQSHHHRTPSGSSVASATESVSTTSSKKSKQGVFKIKSRFF